MVTMSSECCAPGLTSGSAKLDMLCTSAAPSGDMTSQGDVMATLLSHGSCSGMTTLTGDIGGATAACCGLLSASAALSLWGFASGYLKIRFALLLGVLETAGTVLSDWQPAEGTALSDWLAVGGLGTECGVDVWTGDWS